MLIAIHGHPAQAELAVTRNTAKLGREGSATITTLEYGDPGQPGSKAIKVTAQAIDHQGSGPVWLTKQEPVEVEVPAQAPATAAATSG